MSKLSLKTLVRKNLPYGKFKFMVLLAREQHRVYHCLSNASKIEELRTLLRTTCKGQHRLDWETNSRGRRVYTHLYLTDSMDLAMVKLVHHNKLHKMYKIKVEPTPE